MSIYFGIDCSKIDGDLINFPLKVSVSDETVTTSGFDSLFKPDFFKYTSGEVLEVGVDKAYATIQSAINDASTGDTINIYSGTYTGITVNKHVHLVGQETDITSINLTGAINIDLGGVTFLNNNYKIINIQNFRVYKTGDWSGGIVPRNTSVDSIINCRNIKLDVGTNVYPIHMNNTHLGTLNFINSYVDRGYSHVYGYYTGNLCFIKTEIDGPYYAYTSGKALTIADYVTSPADLYGVSYYSDAQYEYMPHFTALDEYNQPMYTEIVHFDYVNKNMYFYTKLPIVYNNRTTFFSIDTELTMEFTGDIGTSVAQNVWDDNFVAIYHMAQDPSTGGACILDSTVNANNGTTVGSMTSGDLIDTAFGKAIDFDGIDDRFTMNHVPTSLLGNSSITLETYGIPKNLVGYDTVAVIGGTDAFTCFGFLLIDGEITNQYGYGNSLNTGVYLNEAESFYLAASKNSSTLADVYIDGNNLTPTVYPTSTTLNIGNSYANVGAWTATTGYYYAGSLSEVRLSDAARSDVWVKATNYSLRDELVYKLVPFEVHGALFLNLIIDCNKIDEDLIDFPVMLHLSSDTYLGNIITELETDENRYKIAVTTADGLTSCYVEIEHWSVADGKATLHVKVPHISSTEDTILYLYYDKNNYDNILYVGDTGSVAAQQVWDSNFAAVYTMAQDPSGGVGCILDSTVNANHGTPYGSMTSDDLVDGLIGKAIEFDGVDDYINCGRDISFDLPSCLTLEGFVKKKENSIFQPIVSKYAWTTDAMQYLLASNPDKKINYSYGTSLGSVYHEVVSSQTWEEDANYHHIATAWDKSQNSGNVKIYFDGISTLIETADAETGDISTGLISDFIIGGVDNCETGETAYSTIEHIRVSNVARTDAWIKTTELSLTNELIYPSFPIECSGTANTSSTTISGALIRLYRFSDGKMVDETYTDFYGDFRMVSIYNEPHYAIAFHPTAAYNALIYAYLAPTLSGV